MAKKTSRQPIVAVLGHVDHGKTSLLDYIRETQTQASEAGGITQSIGAYQVKFKQNKITFIDTPGHAAFSKMRSQGAEVADIAILVIAANDGVKPQTVESINHLKKADIPFLVAINKIDLQEAKPENAKAELTEHEVFVEGYGGNTPVVEISAKTGKNIEELLENLILLSELQELKNKPKSPLKAVVIESQRHPKIGPLASVVVREGTLESRSTIHTPTASGKIKAIYNDQGEIQKTIKPGEPAQILGFDTLPKVGEIITLEPQKQSAEKPQKTESPERALFQKQEDKINLILRADTLGSLTAITDNLTDEINLIRSETGNITESDVLLAQTSDAAVLGFRVKLSNSIRNLAQEEEVPVKTYEVIYELLEDLEKEVLHMLEPTIDEEVLGEAKVLKIFDFGKFRIAGCEVNSGRIQKGDTVHLKRSGKIKNDAKIKTLKTGQKDVDEVKAGNECGILLKPELDIKRSDVIISYNNKNQ